MGKKTRYFHFGFIAMSLCVLVFVLYHMASEYMNALEKDSDFSTLACDTFTLRGDIEVCDSFQVHPKGIMTLCIGYDALVSNNVRVCDVIADGRNVHIQQRRQNIIHAREGVVILGSPETTFYLKRCELKEPLTLRNDLVGIMADTVLQYSDSISFYALSMKDKMLNFYRPKGMLSDSTFKAQAHRAYLKIKKI